LAFLTQDQARAASPLRGQKVLAEAELRKSAAASATATFDVFLSHSREDAEVIAGVKNLLEASGISVYVDWIDDPQLDRSRVTTATAAQLRKRMRQCKSLIFATSKSSSDSKWMPWELGYFDGFKPGHVAILPLVSTPGAGFVGQEYLGLYPYLEEIQFTDRRPGLGIFTTSARDRAAPIDAFVARGVKL
jgi:TIR domain